MKLSTQMKSVTYLKAHASDILRQLAEVPEPFVITQHGRPRAVIQDIVSYEKTQETLAFLKILALGQKQVAEGKVKPAKQVFRELRERLKARRHKVVAP